MAGEFLTSTQNLPEDDPKPWSANKLFNEIKTLLATLVSYSPSKLVFSSFFPSIPTDLQEMYRYTFPVAAQLPIALAESKISGSSYGPTGETTLTIKKLTAAGVATDIGTLVYAETTGAVTITFAAAVSFAAGDSLLIYNQADNDASAQGFAWTFVATRV